MIRILCAEAHLFARSHKKVPQIIIQRSVVSYKFFFVSRPDNLDYKLLLMIRHSE